MEHGDLHNQFPDIYDENDVLWPEFAPKKTMTLEAIFHRRLAKLVTKRVQGYVMQAFRESVIEYDNLK